jgi:SAM-dependent methyltransferase
MPHEVAYNLDADLEHNRKYIGTYFPRSFGESRGIFSRLIRPDMVTGTVHAKPVLRILDIGSGTGGNLCGLLLTLDSKGYPGRVEVISVDGNAIALDLQGHIIQAVKNRGLSFSLAYKQIHTVFDTNQTLFCKQLRTVMGDGDFDVIMAWKTICEYYKHVKRGDKSRFYTGFLDTIAHRLTPKGICVLLDVCTPGFTMESWIPIQMASEIRQHIQQGGSSLGIVSPISCALWGTTCTATNCFKEREITIAYSRGQRTVSKVCYYVFAPRPHAQTFITRDMLHNAYAVSPVREGKVCCQGNLIESVGETYSTYPNAFIY